MIQIIIFVLVGLGVAAFAILALTVVMSYLTQASYVDPIDEGYYDD
jgi:hypothetical protein